MNKVTVVLMTAIIIISPIALNGCATPGGTTVKEKQKNVEDMRSTALNQLYSSKPEARAEIANASGYAVFDAVQTQVLITSSGNAYGIVRDNKTGKDTYMSAFSAGGGIGAGIKSFRAIVIFNDQEVMNEVVNKGWVFGASETADAKVSNTGASTSGSVAFDKRMKIYTITDQGVMVGASLRGVRIWKNEELNN